MTTRPKQSRETVAFITKRHGAYLIAMDGMATEGCTPAELHEAASSLTRAKKVAREMAESFGYTGPWRWNDDEGLLMLEATYTADFIVEDDN